MCLSFNWYVCNLIVLISVFAMCLAAACRKEKTINHMFKFKCGPYISSKFDCMIKIFIQPYRRSSAYWNTLVVIVQRLIYIYGGFFQDFQTNFYFVHDDEGFAGFLPLRYCRFHLFAYPLKPEAKILIMTDNISGFLSQQIKIIKI